MHQDIVTTIEGCAQQSREGKASFGAIVGLLMQAGVESYHADYRGRETHYYLASGEAHSIELDAPAVPIPDVFNAEGMRQAIRGAQSGQVKYPEFMQLSMRAGCVGYIVWIAGRHVAYYGRKGEVHVENFPP